MSNDALHRELLHAGLTAFGFRWTDLRRPLQRVLDTNGNAEIDVWSWNKHAVYTTNGCSAYSDQGSRYRDEFIAHDFLDEEAVLEVLSYAMFFHMTKRSLKPADVVAIGPTSNAIGDYTHLFVSVPFFLPAEVNEIELGPLRFTLSWLMPLVNVEAQFIERHGSDAFESRLKASGYSYFDLRTDLSYLRLD